MNHHTGSLTNVPRKKAPRPFKLIPGSLNTKLCAVRLHCKSDLLYIEQADKILNGLIAQISVFCNKTTASKNVGETATCFHIDVQNIFFFCQTVQYSNNSYLGTLHMQTNRLNDQSSALIE